MLARELMRTEVFTVHEETAVCDLVDTLVGEHIHGAPVVNAEGELVGVVSQLDIFFGTMTLPVQDVAGDAEPPDPGAADSAEPEQDGPAVGAEESDGSGGAVLRVREIMTAPAVAVEETTEVRSLCRTMFRLRIHRLPVVNDGKVTGVISALDLCNAVAEGREF